MASRKRRSSWARQVASWRKRHGYTLDQAAAQLGVDRMTIYWWERGRMPTVKLVRDQVERQLQA